MNHAALAVFDAAGLGEPRHLEDFAFDGLDETRSPGRSASGGSMPGPSPTRRAPSAWSAQGPSSDCCHASCPFRRDAVAKWRVAAPHTPTELARLDELRSELVAVASHELQTPLTTLRLRRWR